MVGEEGWVWLWAWVDRGKMATEVLIEGEEVLEEGTAEVWELVREVCRMVSGDEVRESRKVLRGEGEDIEWGLVEEGEADIECSGLYVGPYQRVMPFLDILGVSNNVGTF